MSPPQKQKRITRNRQALTCTECRRRKLRCDRNTPCENCVKLGDETACTYQRSVNGLAGEREGRSYTEARLQHLEHLVHELSEASDGSSTLARGSCNTAREEAGGGASQGSPSGETTYRGSTHWSEMLAGIDQLRNAIARETTITEFHDDPVNSYDIIFGAVPALNYQEILAQYLPPRTEVDRFVAAYFRSRAIRAPCLHTSQFQRLYTKFWAAPHAALPLWTSMLFSICHVSRKVLITQSDISAPDSRYSFAAAHCLVAGGYHKPRRFAVEALLLYLQVECIGCLDISDEVCILLGLVVRLATRMGYHKEPDNIKFPPFEQEMRRRTWSLAMQLDLLLSFQSGLPSTVQFPTWNTQPPTNLMDSDFDEDSQVLPPARPGTMDTDILFYISKHKLMAVFEKILRHALGPLDGQGDTLSALDNELRATYAGLPEILHPRSMADSVLDPPANIVTRLCVFAIYAKSLCVLHRPYAVRGHPNSIRTCYEAASDLLQYYCDAYPTFQPGGQNESERWFLASISWNDFLTATTVLCLVVCVRSHADLDDHIDSQQTMILLRMAHSACVDQATSSKDMRRVVSLLEHVIRRFGNEETGTAIPEPSPRITSMSYAGSSSTQSAQPVRPAMTVASELQPSGDEGPAFDDTWMFEDIQMMPLFDPSWAYMEEFLQLPDGDLRLY